MLQASRQKRIADYAKTRGLLERGIDLKLSTLLLDTSDFTEVYKEGNMAKMVWSYCNFIFWLRIEQLRLICTDFNGDYKTYKAALEIINGSTNKGFLMLELLSKLVPIGQSDLEAALDYVIENYERNETYASVIERIHMLIFGADEDEKQNTSNRCR